MSRSRVVLVVLFFVALITPIRAADAASSVICTGYSSCSGKGYSHAGYSTAQKTSYWRMYTGTNCTNYVAFRLVKTNGMPNTRPKAGVGNARDWGKAMSSITDSKPSVGSVAWWGKTGNHVAYVEKVVSSTEVWVSESNWSGAFDWRKITKSGSGWPDGFIHFADRVLKNTTKPTLGSTPRVGVALSPSVGKWTIMGNTYAYQWTADGASIKGATAKSYTPTATVVDKDLALTVTASRAGYTSGKASSAATAVKPGSLDTGVPTIDGTARVDEPLSAKPGTWAPAPSTYAYQWSVDGTPVSGATSATFTPGPTAAGLPVTVKVTGTRAGYTPAGATSRATAAVSPGVLTSTKAPTVSGTPAVGRPLTAVPGSWSGSGLTYAYQWYVDGTVVAGATAATYVPVAADRAKPVSVRVTATAKGYVPSSATSSATADVDTGTLPASTATIAGAARLGSLLTVKTGSLDVPGAKVTVQWLRDGKVKAGATSPSRKVISSDLGKQLSAKVTWSAPGYASRTLTTAAVGPAKATATLKVTAKPGKRTVKFAISLPVAGMADPSATISVSRKGGGTVTHKISKGNGTFTLSKQPAGTNTYTFTYRGTSTITSAKATVKSKVS